MYRFAQLMRDAAQEAMPRPMVWEDIEQPCYDDIKMFFVPIGDYQYEWIVLRNRLMVKEDLYGPS